MAGIDDFFDKRAWMLGSLGDILKLIADYGNKDYFLYRIKDMPHEKTDKGFVRHIEVFSVPIEQLADMVQTIKPHFATSTANALLTHYGVPLERQPVSSDKPGEKIEPEGQKP